MKRLALILLVVILSSIPAITAQNFSNSSYTPQRVYDTRAKGFSDFETMLAQLARADVVFVGEEHEDPNTHLLERAILEGLARRRLSVVIALEMFERDVQGSLDDYIAARMSEEEFLRVSRPWLHYATDYRPLIEFARTRHWRVIAANVPHRYASRIAKEGLSTLASLSETERRLVARQIQCPFDDYYKRFVEAMSAHPPASASGASRMSFSKINIERMYYAQCLRDETMAETVADIYRDKPQSRPLTVHFNGAFHSDYRAGVVARAKRRLPQAAIKVISIVPVDNLDALQPSEYSKRADYVVFTLKPHGKAAQSAGR